MKVLLTAINSKYIHTGLGLRYVGGYAREKGHDVVLLEETINTQILAVLENIMSNEADVYGFSVHIWNKPFVFRLARMLKSLRPEAVIVLGGPEVAFAAERAFAELPEADYIIQGEGEIIFSELLESLESKGGIPAHVAYVEQGAVQLNGGVTIIDDLSILPFPYPDLEKVREEHRIVYYEATRGCPFNCAYCLSGISRSVRKRPLEMVLRDMERFIAVGVPLVKFVDRTYNLDEGYFLPMMRYLAAAETDATFHFEIKADILSDEVLDFLSGVPKHRFQLEIGIQSTHQATLKAINRRDDWERLSANIKRLLSFGNMHIHVDLIAGLPYEGLEQFAKSFNDVYGLHAHMLQLGFLKVLPGTQMNKETAEHGLVYMQEPPYEILATKYMDYKEMQLLKRLENVFDQTDNSGAFPRTMAALIAARGLDAFSFYVELTDWWVEQGHYPQSHNAKGTAGILYAYLEQHFDEETVHSIREILRYDMFIAVPGWRAEWLGWNTDAVFEDVSAFWRDEAKVREYLPDYSFSSWRQIHKNYPIERFAIGGVETFVMNMIAEGKLIEIDI